MKKLTSLASVSFLAFLVACALPQQITRNAVIPTITETPPPTEPVLTPTPSATLKPEFIAATAEADALNKTMEPTDASFFSFCGKRYIPEWGNSSGVHIQEIATDWVGIECRSVDRAERFKRFVYRRGIKIWTIDLSDKTLFSLKDNYDISLDVEILLKNANDLYLSPSYHPITAKADAWNPATPLRYKTGLYHLGLKTGDFKSLFNLSSNPALGIAYALSPNEAYLAFSKSDEKNIFYIRDMRKGTDKKIELKADVENIGDFVWTPDSQKVIFVAGLTGWYDNLAGTFIYSYTIQTGQTAVIVHSDVQQRMPFPVLSATGKSYWRQKNFLNLISAQNGTDQWSLDIRNGYIGAVATPTPKP